MPWPPTQMAKWDKIIAVRTAVNGALEAARAEKKIGKSLEADVALTVPAEDAFLTDMDGAALADLLIVSQVEVAVGGRTGGIRQRSCRYQVPPLLEAQHPGGRKRPVPPLRRRGGRAAGVLSHGQRRQGDSGGLSRCTAGAGSLFPDEHAVCCAAHMISEKAETIKEYGTPGGIPLRVYCCSA